MAGYQETHRYDRRKVLGILTTASALGIAAAVAGLRPPKSSHGIPDVDIRPKAVTETNKSSTQDTTEPSSIEIATKNFIEQFDTAFDSAIGSIADIPPYHGLTTQFDGRISFPLYADSSMIYVYREHRNTDGSGGALKDTKTYRIISVREPLLDQTFANQLPYHGETATETEFIFAEGETPTVHRTSYFFREKEERVLEESSSPLTPEDIDRVLKVVLEGINEEKARRNRIDPRKI